MSNITTRYYIVILFLAISSVLSYLLSYGTSNQTEIGFDSIKKIPLNFEKWKGEDVSLENLVYEILETKSIIHRKYVSDDGYEVFLSIVYYPETKVDFHSPEGCLGGQGISVDKTQKIIKIVKDGKIFQIELNQLIRNHLNQQSLIYYFYKAGNFLGQSYIKLRFNLALNKFQSNEKSGALIRVSTPFNMNNIDNNAAILNKFIQEIIPYVIEYL